MRGTQGLIDNVLSLEVWKYGNLEMLKYMLNTEFVAPRSERTVFLSSLYF